MGRVCDAADRGLARKLGLSEYAQCFVDNAVDLSVIPDLTEQDLKDLGVLLGHRRRMLRAIAEFNRARRHQPNRCRERGANSAI